MIFLLASVACSTAIYVIFKLFGKYGIRTFQGIVANYFVASSFGFWYAYAETGDRFSPAAAWMGIAVLIGALFISLFYIMALTSQTYGVSVTSIATKMSMVIPAAYFIISDPSESAGAMKILGIVFGVIAVVLAATKEPGGTSVTGAAWIPILLFVGSGFLDLLLAFVEKSYLGSDAAYRQFVPVPFGVAAALGAVVLALRVLTGAERIHLPSLAAGLVLGLVNYGSIYFLLKVLGGDHFDRSSAIPANNMGIVALSALVGFLLFKERLSPKNMVGIGMALLAIALLTIANI